MAPIALLAIIVSGLYVQERRAELEGTLTRVARALVAATDSELNAQITALETASIAESLRSDRIEDFRPTALEALSVHGSWLALMVDDVATGRQVFSSRASERSVPAPDLDSLLQAARSGRPVIGPVLAGMEGLERPFVLIRTPLYRNDDVPLVLSAAVNPRVISKILADQRSMQDLLFTAYDKNLTISASSTGDRVVGRRATESLSTHVTSGRTGLFVNTIFDGTNYYRVVEQSTTTGWRVAVGIRTDLFNQRTWEVIWEIVGMFALATIVSVGGAWFLGRRFIGSVVAVESRARKTAEAAKALAERADKAKSQFLAAASHDLRQPFQAMRLYHELARHAEGRKRDDALVRLGVALNSGETLLSALLDVSALEAGSVKPLQSRFPIDDLLYELRDQYQIVAQEQGLSLRIVPSTCWVQSDRVLLKRMLGNLLVNALRYTKRGSILVGCRRRGSRLAIEVWDTGIGIPAEQQQSIFEEFVQLDNAARNQKMGLGLGLAIVSKTARLLGHTILVRSVPGAGSVFAIEVQRVKVPAG